MKCRMLVGMVVFCVASGGLMGMEGGPTRPKLTKEEVQRLRTTLRKRPVPGPKPTRKGPEKPMQRKPTGEKLKLPTWDEVRRMSKESLPELPTLPEDKPEGFTIKMRPALHKPGTAVGYTMMKGEQPGQLTMVFNTILGYFQTNPTELGEKAKLKASLLQLLPLEGAEPLNISDELEYRNENIIKGLETPSYTGYLGRINELYKLLNGLETAVAIWINGETKDKEGKFFTDERDVKDPKIALVNASMAKKMLEFRANNLDRMVSYCNFRQNDSVSIFTEVASYLSYILSYLDIRDTVNRYSLSEKVPFEYSLTCAISLYRLLVVTLKIIQKVNDDFGDVKGVKTKVRVPFAGRAKAVEYDVWNALIGLRGVNIIRDMNVLIDGFVGKLEGKDKSVGSLWKTKIDTSKLTKEQMEIFLNLQEKLYEINEQIRIESVTANEKWKELTVPLGAGRGRRGSK